MRTQRANIQWDARKYWSEYSIMISYLYEYIWLIFFLYPDGTRWGASTSASHWKNHTSRTDGIQEVHINLERSFPRCIQSARNQIQWNRSKFAQSSNNSRAFASNTIVANAAVASAARNRWANDSGPGSGATPNLCDTKWGRAHAEWSSRLAQLHCISLSGIGTHKTNGIGRWPQIRILHQASRATSQHTSEVVRSISRVTKNQFIRYEISQTRSAVLGQHHQFRKKETTQWRRCRSRQFDQSIPPNALPNYVLWRHHQSGKAYLIYQ